MSDMPFGGDAFETDWKATAEARQREIETLRAEVSRLQKALDDDDFWGTEIRHYTKLVERLQKERDELRVAAWDHVCDFDIAFQQECETAGRCSLDDALRASEGEKS